MSAFLQPQPAPICRPPTAAEHTRHGRAGAAPVEARRPTDRGPCWRVVGYGVRYCHLNEFRRGGFLLVSDYVRAKWSRTELAVPGEDVFTDYIAALTEFRRRRAKRQPAAAGAPA